MTDRQASCILYQFKLSIFIFFLSIYVNQNSIKYDGWEINSNDIKIGNRIGSGAFGTVFSATINTGALARLKYAKKIADSVLLSQQNLKVAVKILKGIDFFSVIYI